MVIKNKIENLSLHQYRLIGDLSAFPKKIKKKYDFVLQKFFTNLWEDHFSQLGVFKPENSMVVAWKFFMLVQIIFQLFVIPVRISFQLKFSENLEFALYQAPGIALIFDILLNFNTAYYEEGILVLDRKKISNNYLKTSFWIDLISTFSLFFSGAFQLGLIDLLFLTRILLISDLSSKLIDHF